MDTKKLRQKILDLAIRGKLVPQDPNDEPASVLLERIKAEKEQLIKEGKIKRSKQSASSDTFPYENVPFEIPESWAWTTLGNLYNVISAKRVLQSEWVHSGIPFYRAREIAKLANDGYVDNDLFITEEHYNKLKEQNGIPVTSDIMLSAVGTIGKNYIVSANDKFYYKDASVLCLQNIHNLYSKYFSQMLYATYIQSQMYDNSKGTTVDTITIERANNYIVPLPPIEEQFRIVRAVEDWFSVIDKIEREKTDLENAIKQAKSKILDRAIHGELVPQDPNDEPAIDLLRRINHDFQPCDNVHKRKNLPKGWIYCTIQDSFNITMGSSPTGENLNRDKQGVEFHQGKVYFSDKYILPSDIYTTQPIKYASPMSLLLCIRAPVGIVNITNRLICIGRGLCSLQPSPIIDLQYGYYIIQTCSEDLEQKATGSTFKAVGSDIVKNQMIPIPPYAEQLRIVAKIEELFATLDKIKEPLEV